MSEPSEKARGLVFDLAHEASDGRGRAEEVDLLAYIATLEAERDRLAILAREASRWVLSDVCSCGPTNPDPAEHREGCQYRELMGNPTGRLALALESEAKADAMLVAREESDEG